MSDISVLLRGGIGLAGFLVFNWRLRDVLRAHQRSRPHTHRPPDVSLIIPARNEAGNLGALLRSIALLDPAPKEVIVVDDHSTDDTGAIAASFGVRVVVPGPLPSGWIGKPWACAAGAAAATSPLLLFTDADTVHAPDLLGNATHALDQQQADLLSVVPWHRVVASWERFQSIFHMLLLVAGGAGARKRRGERSFCIGQYLLIRRSAYDRIGGHFAVRHRVAEDLGFAALIERHGLRFVLVHAGNALKVRMYPEGLRSFVAGWRRNFRPGILAAGFTGTLETALVLGWLFDVPRWLLQAWWAGNSWSMGFAAASAIATCLVVGYWQRKFGEFRAIDAVAYPLFALLFVWASFLALSDRLLRKPIVWRGRSVRTDELGTD